MVDTPRTRAYLLGSEYEDGQFQGISAQDLRDGFVTILGPSVTLTPVSGAVTWSLASAPIATVTITQNTTITVTGGEDGFPCYELWVYQGGAGSFTPTFSGLTTVPASPTWSTTAGSFNRVYPAIRGSTIVADVV